MAFVPATSEGEDMAFATGLVIDVRTSLSLWRWFPVIGPEALSWKTARDGDLREMARSVRAAYAISGAMRRAGDRIRVTASLTDVASGHLVWTETFDGVLSDVFEMQEDISQAVVARVTPAIGAAQAARLTRQAPADLTTWQLMAQVDELERTGGEGYGTPESNRAQLAPLQEVVRRDPTFARARALLARYYFRAGLQGWVNDREAAFQAALEHAGQAVALDPSSWEGRAYLALTLIFGTKAHQG